MNKLISARRVVLLTGGIDKHYACGLSKSLAMSGINVDVICNTDMDTCEMRNVPNLRLITLYNKPRRRQGIARKLLMHSRVYFRLIRYAATSSALIIHILWNYKFTFFDRILLLAYYKLLGKRLVLTAHNVNAAERDGVDCLWNRVSLRIQYRLVNHIFVHTESMKTNLVQSFGVDEHKVTVIPFGTYDMVPHSSLTSEEAKDRLGLSKSNRTVLFFGRITPYKGVDLLVDAFRRLTSRDQGYRLIIAGEPMKESEQQWRLIQEAIEQSPMREQVFQEIRHIEDHEIEVYFKAADVIVLPYTKIFQSGILFMAYSFGLPVIATDVGSFTRDIVAGVTGYLCRPGDSVDLARVIKQYFSSELFEMLEDRRSSIQELIHGEHSWDIVANKTADVYAQLSQSKQLRYGM
jgi:D-inositol-3-phosphate glycosyltransferase